MRELADSASIERFMRALGGVPEAEGRVYPAGGATAVLNGWRASTIDVDIKIIPDRDELLRAIPRLKEELNLTVTPAEGGPLFNRQKWSGFQPALTGRARSRSTTSIRLPRHSRRQSVTTGRTSST